MTTVPSLRGLQAFEAAARTGSFVAAADELGISAAAVSQLIRALEDQVSRRLFLRINRRVVLTEAGRDIFPQLAGAFQEIKNVSRELVGGDRRSSLVVSVPPSVAMGWLSSRLKKFIHAYGPVDVSLRGEDDPVPFERDIIDIRFTYGPLHYSEYLTEELGIDAVYPVCSPDFLERHRLGHTPESLLAAPLIHTDWGPSGASFPSWRRWFEAAAVAPSRTSQRGLTANSSMAALDLALGGLGIALAQGLFCAQAIEKDLLLIPVHHALRLNQPYTFTTTQRSAQRPVVVAFKSWLAAECLQAFNSPVFPLPQPAP